MNGTYSSLEIDPTTGKLRILNRAEREEEAYRHEWHPPFLSSRVAIANKLRDAAELIRNGDCDGARRIAEADSRVQNDIYLTLCEQSQKKNKSGSPVQ
jgi:hypothetical protein